MIPTDFGYICNTAIQNIHNDFTRNYVLHFEGYTSEPVEYLQKVLGAILSVGLGYYRAIRLIRIKE